MGENNWLTITELAEETKIADSTIRRYLHTYTVFFKHDGNVRGRRYEKNAIKVLNRIRELYEKGYDNRKVHSFLEEEFTVILDSEKVKNDSGNSHENSQEDSEKSPYIAIRSEDLEGIKLALAEQKEFNKVLLGILQRQEMTIQKQAVMIRELVEDQEKERLLLSTIEEMAATKTETDTEGRIEEVVQEKPKKKGFLQKIFGG